MTFYVNQEKVEEAYEGAVAFLMHKYRLSEGAAEQLITLFYSDKLRDDEYTEDQLPALLALENKGFGEFERTK